MTPEREGPTPEERDNKEEIYKEIVDNLDTWGEDNHRREEVMLSEESTYRSGGQYEADLLTTVETNEKAIRKFQDSSKRRNYDQRDRDDLFLGYPDAVEFAMKNQPELYDRDEGKETEWDPEAPPKQAVFLQDLTREIRHQLREKEQSPLDPEAKILGFTGVDTPIDKFHSTDAFIIIQTKEGENKMLSIDVTQRMNEDLGKTDADLLVKGDLPAPEHEIDEYLEAIYDRLAPAAIEVLKDKYPDLQDNLNNN